MGKRVKKSTFRIAAYGLLVCGLSFGVALLSQGFVVREELSKHFLNSIKATEATRGHQGLVLDTGGLGTMILNQLLTADVQVVEFEVGHPGKQTYLKQFNQPSTLLSPFVVHLAEEAGGYVFRARVLPSLTFLEPHLLVAVFLGLFAGVLTVLTLAWMREVQEAEKLREREHIAKQVAHDIRSPMSALTVVQEDYQGPYSSVLKQALDRMQGILNDLSPLPSTGSALEPIRLHETLSPLIAEKIANSGPNSVSIVSKIDLLPSLSIQANAMEIQRVVSNLIDNAVEASAPGQEVSLEVFQKRKSVVIIVQDRGKGIPAELVRKLGRRGATFGKRGGSGLGLAHAFEHVEKWDGSLRIRSKPNQGTRVQIQLPVQA